MGKEKPFRTLNELVRSLNTAEEGMGKGTLGLEGLETAVADARELYERLVVLRHKAREAALAGDAAKGVEAVVEKAAPPVEAAPEAAGIRLDTRPPEVSPRQTSLIEAIEASQEEAPAPAAKPVERAARNTAPAPAPAKEAAKPPPTLAEKLEKAAIADLAKAISLSHKFWFVSELFNGDRITYDKTISALNNFTDKDSAMTYLEKEVLGKLAKPADPEAVTTFTELLQRRFA